MYSFVIYMVGSGNSVCVFRWGVLEFRGRGCWRAWRYGVRVGEAWEGRKVGGGSFYILKLGLGLAVGGC